MPPHTDIRHACRLIAHTFYGERGIWLYDVFEAINRAFFDGALPYPHIVLGLTAHGSCLGWTMSFAQGPPIIDMHPSLFGGTEKANPWEVPPSWLGYRFALDTLVHECMHVSVNYRLGGAQGPTSHNNPQWIGEVNRLAPLLGFDNVDARISTTKRVPVDGPLTKRGKQPTKVARVSEGSIPFDVASRFPRALRLERGEADSYYEAHVTPQEILQSLSPPVDATPPVF